jgi:stearoyl-CoA desaturase (delta-9 desaturase)
MSWVASIPFLLVHVIGLVGIFFVPFAWKWVALAAALYAVRMFAITAGYHRYFSHRAYKTSRGFQFFLALLGTLAAQKGVLWWAGHHRHHHKFSDTPADLHSPKQQGFWWSHVGWILSTRYNDTPWERIKDFAKYPELRWLNRHFLLPPVALAATLFLLGGSSALVWGFFFSTVMLWHGTFTINSLSHVFGRRRFATTDTSKNNFALALLTLGEGWHNNHHYYQSTANQGFYWWEIDVSYYTLRALASVGLVWGLRTPPAHVLAAGRRKPIAIGHAMTARRTT